MLARRRWVSLHTRTDAEMWFMRTRCVSRKRPPARRTIQDRRSPCPPTGWYEYRAQDMQYPAGICTLLTRRQLNDEPTGEHTQVPGHCPGVLARSVNSVISCLSLPHLSALPASRAPTSPEKLIQAHIPACRFRLESDRRLLRQPDADNVGRRRATVRLLSLWLAARFIVVDDSTEVVSVGWTGGPQS